MNTRVSIFGKGQGLEGDLTSTGAICIASQARGKVGGRRWLLQGDKTTACPHCGEEGTLVNGETRWRQDGIPSVVDGTPVKCGCPPGSNYVIAQSQHQAAPQAATTPPPEAATARPAQRPSPSPAQAFANSRSSVSAMPGSLEPGFHIVQRHSTFAQLLMKLFDAGNAAPIARLQRLNPTFAQGFKAGEIFVIGDPDNGHACTREEAELMTAAERARVALTGLDESEADFMMQHIGEIAGLLNGASQSMGVGKDMLAYSLGRVEDTLKGIERLHQQEFMKHGHLNSSQFFASRKKLYHQLESQLRSAFLNRHLSLGDHSSLKRGLGISTKSLVHHWSKAGAPGQIPGYASHLDEVAKTSKFLQYGGHVGIGLGFSNSILKIYEACRAGETENCKKVRLKETGSFIGGMAGGGAGAKVGEMTGRIVCTIAAKTITKGAGSSICMIGIVGTGAFLGATSIGGAGEALGEVLYDFTTD